MPMIFHGKQRISDDVYKNPNGIQEGEGDDLAFIDVFKFIHRILGTFYMLDTLDFGEICFMIYHRE